MKTTFEETKSNSIDLLCKTREMSTLLEIKNEINSRQLCLNCFGNEYDYAESLGATKAFKEIEDLINSKIEKLKQ